MNHVMNKNESTTTMSQPIRKFASEKRKIALQVCIVSAYIFVFGYGSMKNENIVERLIVMSPVLLLAGFLLWRQRPIWVELYSDRMRYRSFLGKKHEVCYTQMQSVVFKKRIYKINFILPVYGYTKYYIYIAGKNGHRKKINMSSLACDDFIMIWKMFLKYGETREEIELCEKLKTPYYSKKFLVPTKKLKDSYYYIGKRIGLLLMVIDVAWMFWGTLQYRYNSSILEWIMAFMGGVFLSVSDLLIGYILVRFIFYRKAIDASKKVPKEVYVCQEYIQIDGKKFLFDKITDGYVVPSKFRCERFIEFTYEGREFQFTFGKYRRFLLDYFNEYRVLELYLRGRGFERWIGIEGGIRRTHGLNKISKNENTDKMLKIEIYGYEMEYYDVCQEIWEKYVPDTGKSEALQGELLRLTEFLRSNALEENKDWNVECENACDFLEHYFVHDEENGVSDKSKMQRTLSFVRERGRNKSIYKNLVLFDYIEDEIARIDLKNGEAIPYYYQKGDF